MIHFETIWNEAESVSKSYTDLKRKEILTRIRENVNNLSDADEFDDYHEAMGNILFELCSLCAHLEDKKRIQINSAAALAFAIERKRKELLNQKS